MKDKQTITEISIVEKEKKTLAKNELDEAANNK